MYDIDQRFKIVIVEINIKFSVKFIVSNIPGKHPLSLQACDPLPFITNLDSNQGHVVCIRY